jgi:hypothetical protein
MGILTNIQEALQEMEMQAAQREQAFRDSLPAPPSQFHEGQAWQECQKRLKQRLGDLEACVKKAQENADQVDTNLATTESVLRHCLEATQEVGKQLGTKPTVSIG